MFFLVMFRVDVYRLSITDATETNIPKIGPNKYFINVFIFISVRIKLPYVYTNNNKNNQVCPLSMRFVLIILTIICIVVTLLPKRFFVFKVPFFGLWSNYIFFFDTLFGNIYYVQPSEPNRTNYSTINELYFEINLLFCQAHGLFKLPFVATGEISFSNCMVDICSGIF